MLDLAILILFMAREKSIVEDAYPGDVVWFYLIQVI